MLVPTLEQRAQVLATEWGLVLGEPFPSSPSSYVVAAGNDAVLKIRATEDWESDHDVDALMRWNGRGAVRVRRYDRDRRAVLLDRARPGQDLSSTPWNESFKIAADVARQLWIPASAPFRSIHEFVGNWLADVNANERVRRLYESLEPRADTLIHGDLHHHNLLRDGASWLAIDSKAMLGEPEFDVAPLLWNPVDSELTNVRIERCLDAFAAAGLDRARMRAWGLIRATYLEQHGAAALLESA